VGNHDYSDKAKSYHSLMNLSILYEHLPDNVSVLAPGSEAVVKGIQFWCPETWEELVSVKGAGEFEHTVAIWHGIVPGLSVRAIEEDYASTALGKSVKKAFRNSPNLLYIALGDIHKRCKVGERCYYPGALVQKTFSCEDGLVLFSSDKSKEPEILSLGLGKKKTFRVEFSDGEDSEQDIITFVQENFTKDENARLMFELPNKMYSALDRKLIKEQLVGFVNSIKFDNQPVVDKRTRELSQKIVKAKTIEEEISAAIAYEDFDLDNERIMNTCKRFA